MPIRFRLLFSLLSIAIGAGIFWGLTYVKLPVLDNNPSQDFPELADLMNPNQEVRLKAGRRLAERVGVEQALDMLERSPLPRTGEGHLIVHQIGFYAYQTYGLDSILHCRDYFLNACYHGVIIEMATNQGVEAIPKMTDRCKGSPSRYFQCAHAAGHATLAMLSYDLPAALKTCDLLFEKETQFPEALTSCHNGAFMENIFGVHDWGTGAAPVRDWLKDDDPYYPCSAFGEKYQKGCWLNQAARIYQLNQGNIEASAYGCRMIGNAEYTEWCLDNLSRQIHALVDVNVPSVYSYCAQLGIDWREKCVVINANSFYSVGGRVQALDLCRAVSVYNQEQCYRNIISQIIGDSINEKEKKLWCQRIIGWLAGECLKGIKI